MSYLHSSSVSSLFAGSGEFQESPVSTHESEQEREKSTPKMVNKSERPLFSSCKGFEKGNCFEREKKLIWPDKLKFIPCVYKRGSPFPPHFYPNRLQEDRTVLLRSGQ